MTDAGSKLDALRRAVDGQGRSFYARDVWEHETVQVMYRPSETRRSEHGYRRRVGKDLMAYRRELSLTDTHRQKDEYGRLWEKA